MSTSPRHQVRHFTLTVWESASLPFEVAYGAI
jgi:hypothetical protein